MPRRTKEERLELTKKTAMEIGLPERHAAVLAKISFRRNLDGRVRYLMGHTEYRQMMDRYRQMNEDQTRFYLENKSLIIKGSKRFPRYGSLSLAYSMASPYQLIMFLLEDAYAARIESKIISETTGKPAAYEEEYSYDLFEEQRFKRLETAFRQDLRGNGIPMELVDTLLDAVKWRDATVSIRVRDFATTKQDIMDAFYLFFGSNEGKNFVEQWETEPHEALIDSFSYRFFNDPRVNPKLVNMELRYVGTKEYEEMCMSFGDSIIFYPDGTTVKRSEIDARKTRIM